MVGEEEFAGDGSRHERVHTNFPEAFLVGKVCTYLDTFVEVCVLYQTSVANRAAVFEKWPDVCPVEQASLIVRIWNISPGFVTQQVRVLAMQRLVCKTTPVPYTSEARVFNV